MALQVTQVKSSNGAKRNQLATLESLGLRRMRHTVVVPDRPEIRGMVATVNHLVAVREVPDGTSVAPKASRRLSASDAGEPGAVGVVDGHSAEVEELLEEQGHAGKGIDNPSDVVQHAMQKTPDDVIVKAPSGPADADAAPDATDSDAGATASDEEE
ncbi:hypothetical protein BH23ACT9_BH23ACT9_19060 [soil metagenome]